MKGMTKTNMGESGEFCRLSKNCKKDIGSGDHPSQSYVAAAFKTEPHPSTIILDVRNQKVELFGCL